jgi:hypothetical protein
MSKITPAVFSPKSAPFLKKGEALAKPMKEVLQTFQVYPNPPVAVNTDGVPAGGLS